MKVIRIIFLSALLMGFTGVVQAENLWGALAIDANTGIAGGASDADNKYLAEQVATTSCREKHNRQKLPNNCKAVVNFSNTCAAIAWNSRTKRYGWGTDFENTANAASRAVGQCGSSGCPVVLSFCTTRIFY